jgi:hypothetical protein
MDGKNIERALNDLIAKVAKNGGHVWIVDRLGNNFLVRATNPIDIKVYNGYKEDNDG